MSVGPAASPIDVASAQHQLGRLHSNFPDVAGTPPSLANFPVTPRAAPSSHSRAQHHPPRATGQHHTLHVTTPALRPPPTAAVVLVVGAFVSWSGGQWGDTRVRVVTLRQLRYSRATS